MREEYLLGSNHLLQPPFHHGSQPHNIKIFVVNTERRFKDLCTSELNCDSSHFVDRWPDHWNCDYGHGLFTYKVIFFIIILCQNSVPVWGNLCDLHVYTVKCCVTYFLCKAKSGEKYLRPSEYKFNPGDVLFFFFSNHILKY